MELAGKSLGVSQEKVKHCSKILLNTMLKILEKKEGAELKETFVGCLYRVVHGNYSAYSSDYRCRLFTPIHVLLEYDFSKYFFTLLFRPPILIYLLSL